MEENTTPKRKTRTSSAVKNRYNAKTYKRYQTAIKPPIMERIEDYNEREAISKAQFLERAIEALDH